MKINLFKRLFFLLTIFIGIMALWFGSQWINNGGLPANKASGQILPINITKVQPYDGEVIPTIDSYCLDFDYRAGNGMGGIPLKSIHMFFDGIDVTNQTDALITLDIPPSSGLICYKPGTQFSKGWHTSKVTYLDKKGESFTYLWRFFVSN